MLSKNVQDFHAVFSIFIFRYQIVYLMFYAHADNITFLVLTGNVVALKATLETRIEEPFFCCFRGAHKSVVKIWIRMRALDGTEEDHYDEFIVPNQAFGSKVIRNIYSQFESYEHEVSKKEDIEHELQELLHTTEYSHDASHLHEIIPENVDDAHIDIEKLKDE